MMTEHQPDPFDLDRFVAAQQAIWDDALAELRAGQKRSHWMWFVFPQLAGLGSSSMAARYAIVSRGEAEDYTRHPVLGPRLCTATEAVLSVSGRSVAQIFGYPDDLKFHSSMTLFAETAPPRGNSVFEQALDKHFGGARDQRTLMLLKQMTR